MQVPHADSLPSDSASVDRAAALRQLTRQVIVRGGLFAAGAAALLGGGMLLAARELVLTLKAARQAAPGARLELGLMLEQRPDVVGMCAGLRPVSLPPPGR